MGDDGAGGSRTCGPTPATPASATSTPAAAGEGDLLKAATDAFGEVAWVFGRDQLVDEGWLGPEPPPGDVLTRIGDVTLAAKGTVAFADPTHPHETRLRAGHGSLSPDEMLVPLLAGRGRRP